LRKGEGLTEPLKKDPEPNEINASCSTSRRLAHPTQKTVESNLPCPRSQNTFQTFGHTKEIA